MFELGTEHCIVSGTYSNESLDKLTEILWLFRTIDGLQDQGIRQVKLVARLLIELVDYDE